MGLYNDLLTRENGYCVPFDYVTRDEYYEMVHWIKERGTTFTINASEKPHVLIFPDATTAVVFYFEFADRLHKAA